MWPGKTQKRRRRDAELSPQDEQRIDEIRRSFEEKGWRLVVKEDDGGSWVAWFFHEELGPTTNDVVRGPTALGTALAAWEKFRSEPHLSGRRVK